MSSVRAPVTELNVILLGPPGAGKGTQGDRLKDDFSLPYLVTGGLLRAAKADPDNELGRQAKEFMERGDLVPDELVIGLILQKIEDEGQEGFLLDGYPRTIPQAEALDEAVAKQGKKVTAALLIEVPDEELIKRISGRRQCSEGHIYNIYFDPPKHEGHCDRCGKPLNQREDDQEDVVRNRLDVYHSQTEPLVEYYERQGVLKRFDGTLSPSEVHDRMRASMAALKLENS